jgi:AcrR family transcriptional regulator
MNRRGRRVTGTSLAVSSAATRRAILDAGEQILATRDADELSIREVCARAGVTAPTVYHHFGDRQALIDRVVDDCFARFGQWLLEHPPPADPVDALHWGFDRYVEFGLAHPNQYRLLFGRRHANPSAQGLAAYDRLRRGMSDVARVGRLRDDTDVDAATLAYWTAMHGVTALAILGVVPPGSHVLTLAREAIIERITRPRPPERPARLRVARRPLRRARRPARSSRADPG